MYSARHLLALKEPNLSGPDAGKGRTLRVRVYPGASNPRVEEEPDGLFRVYVSAAPRRGKANAELLKAISRHMGIAKSSITIEKGLKSREKVLRIEFD